MVWVEIEVLEELLIVGLTEEEEALLEEVTVDPYPEKLK